MASEASQEGQRRRVAQPETAAVPPETALGVWLSWLQGHRGAPAAQALGFGATPGPGGQAPWLTTPEAVAGDGMAAGLDRLTRMLAKDPMLGAIDRVWNANPLHDVIPVDWAEVVRALRTVWLRRMADPARTVPALAELNVRMVQSAVEAWNSAAARWWGLASATPQPGLGTGDKRFSAPEWHANPVYRTLKDLYLLASDFLLKESEAEDLDPAERERLRFHLEQFVNATSPTLLLFSNPAALRRAMETGGASIADGARNLLNDLNSISFFQILLSISLFICPFPRQLHRLLHRARGIHRRHLPRPHLPPPPHPPRIPLITPPHLRPNHPPPTHINPTPPLPPPPPPPTPPLPPLPPPPPPPPPPLAHPPPPPPPPPTPITSPPPPAPTPPPPPTPSRTSPYPPPPSPPTIPRSAPPPPIPPPPTPLPPPPQEGRLSMVDATAFEPGRNLATTPGKVVHRNRLIELIQYAPQTDKVREVPLLFFPPWINKYYILDMQPKNSFVRYLVEQGFTVFVVSWKNPDASMEGTTFEDYMRDGPLAAAEVVREITGSRTVNPVGYCIGGTLLAVTLAYLAAKGEKEPFGTATFMVSLQDFSKRRRDLAVHGRDLDRLHRAADDGARLSRQPRDVGHVQPACAPTT